MNQEKRMHANLPYKAWLDGLTEQRTENKKRIYEFNNLPPQRWEEIPVLLKKILGKTGENVFVEAPFHCDYGKNIEVGENFFANYNLTILDVGKVRIGKNAMFAPNVSIYTAGHPLHPDSRNSGYEYGIDVTIGDNVWLGGNVSVMPGVRIGDNVVIGGGSVVTKDIPDWSVAVGNPCRVIRKITEEDRKFYFGKREFDEEAWKDIQGQGETPGEIPGPEDVKRVKGLGFLQDKRTGTDFNARVITGNGKITTEEARVIAEAADLFGNGELAMTTRMTIEIQGIPYENIEPLRTYLKQAGLETGGTGPKVRPVVSCKGTTCQYGLIDTFALSEEIHKRFYVGYHDVPLPHKFKIAVGGCPNNCVKPDLNDLGIIGQRVPVADAEKCKGCKACKIEKACPMHAAALQNGKITIDENICNHCGRCLGKCPFGAFEGHIDGYRIYIGGRWGKKTARGRYLEKVFTDREEVLKVVEKAILLFRSQGIAGERFADTVERLGFENVVQEIASL